MAKATKNQNTESVTVQDEEQYVPMAVPPMTMQDYLEAMEARVTALERQVARHEAYHFGKRE